MHNYSFIPALVPESGGNGSDGATFVPSVSEDGTLSWTNNGDLPNPDPVNIKGPPGSNGAPGSQGSPGPAGNPGAPGMNGSDGEDGATFTPSVSEAGVLSWTNDGGLTNPEPVSIKGPPGADGASGEAGPAGPAGETGQRGEPGVGVPTGGMAGQFLKKVSGTDYDTQWADPPEGGGDTTYLLRAPVGTIVIWSGTADNIPTGWQLCDGTNDTPDLRDKFVLGAGNKYDVGATGGSEEVTLTIAQMPSHQHTILAYSSGASDAGTNRATATTKVSKQMNVSSQGEGSSKPHSNMPPYYSLCYIMKIAADETDASVPNGGTTGQVLAKASDQDGDVEWVDQSGNPNLLLNSITRQLAITSAMWTEVDGGYKATVSCPGVLPNEEIQNIYSAPAVGSQSAYEQCAIKCIAQQKDELVYWARSLPPAIVMYATLVNASNYSTDLVVWSPKMTSNIVPKPYRIIDVQNSITATNYAWRLFDGSLSTASVVEFMTNQEAFVRVDLGSEITIYGIAVVYNADYVPLEFSITGSADNMTYTKIATITPSDYLYNQANMYYFNPVSYRYYGIEMSTSTINGSYPSFREVGFIRPASEVS